MADDEQFSLCWNNFNSNLSAGFHQSLVNGDLVDVTLAAEGKLVMAHRLVLSVCSPFFRQMFTQAPTNQPVFVFLKDVSHSALKDLIQFMYCGEVNVKQDALPAFISTAEALQIKGLTDSDPAPAQSPAEATPAPQPQIHQITTSPRTRQSQRTTTQKYKVETVEDTTDDRRQTTQIVIQTTAAPPAAIAQPVHHVQQQQQQQISNASTSSAAMVQRGAKRTAGVLSAQPKRTKTTIDPLDSQDAAATSATQQITVQAAVIDHPRVQQQQQQQQQAQSEPEYIDLPIELPTKAEPDYAEDGTEIDEADQDGTYVENDDYTDFQTRYDENYFTENEEAGNVTTGGNASGDSTAGAIATGGATTSKALMKQQLSDSSYVDPADQSTTDAQASVMQYIRNCGPQLFIISRKGGTLLAINDFIYRSNFKRFGRNNDKVYWECVHNRSKKCRSRLKTIGDDLYVTNDIHNHAGDERRIKSAQHSGLLVYKKFSALFTPNAAV